MILAVFFDENGLLMSLPWWVFLTEVLSEVNFLGPSMSDFFSPLILE